MVDSTGRRAACRPRGGLARPPTDATRCRSPAAGWAKPSSGIRGRSGLGSRACTVASNLSERSWTAALYSRVHPSARRRARLVRVADVRLLRSSRRHSGGPERSAAKADRQWMRQYRACRCENDEPPTSGPGRRRATGCRRSRFGRRRHRQDVMRRYRPVEDRRQSLPGPWPWSSSAACLMLGLRDLERGLGLMTGFIGQIAGLRQRHQPAWIAGSGHARRPRALQLDTPVLDTPPNGGYTNQSSIPLLGSVPGAAVGKTGYSVHVYLLGKNGLTGSGRHRPGRRNDALQHAGRNPVRGQQHLRRDARRPDGRGAAVARWLPTYSTQRPPRSRSHRRRRGPR